jgi:hypothetical protein
MSFTDSEIALAWEKATIVANNNPAVWRKDQCGAWIRFSDYGNRSSHYGWEVDHISPGDNNDSSNLRPLHWINNVEKSDGRLTCPVVSYGVKNSRRLS